MVERYRPSKRVNKAKVKPHNPNGGANFHKGHEKLGGRRKGTPNKRGPFYITVSDCLEDAMELLGQDGKGTDGVTGYFMKLLWTRPELAIPLMMRILPAQVNVDASTTTTTTHTTTVNVGVAAKLAALDPARVTVAEVAELYREAIASLAPDRRQPAITAN